MYIKIIEKNKESIQIKNLLNYSWFLISPLTGFALSCDAQRAEGIMDDENGTLYFKVGLNPHNQAQYWYTEISQEEYERLLREEPDLEDTEPQLPEAPEEEVAPELPLTRAELTEKIRLLEERNEFLEECLLEMSEIVYNDN